MNSVLKLSLPLVTVATLLVAALGAGATYGATSSTISAVTQKVDALQHQAESLEREQAAARERLSRIETALEYQNDSLRRIELRLGTHP